MRRPRFHTFPAGRPEKTPADDAGPDRGGGWLRPAAETSKRRAVIKEDEVNLARPRRIFKRISGKKAKKQPERPLVSGGNGRTLPLSGRFSENTPKKLFPRLIISRFAGILL